MATVYTAAGTGQPFLDLMPINTSFAEYQKHHHTTVGSAPISPPLSPSSSLARPPTPGFGPLSSHPATPVNGGSYFPPPSSYKSSGSPKSSSETASTKSTNQRRDSILYLPPSPASQKCQTPPPPPQLRRRDSAGVKRLLSFATLRKSFMGGDSSNGNSNISLPLSRTPTASYENAYTINPSRRPSSPSLSSSTTNSSLNAPPVIHAYIPAPQPRTVPQLRKRKSASWFRRKSGLFMMDSDFKELENVTETPSRPATAIGFERMLSPAPVLPDVGSLRGGRLTDGAFAGEDIFGARR